MEIGDKILSFLNECVQGPCKQNQDTLIYYKIYDYTRDYMHDLNHQDQLMIRGFPRGERSESLDDLFLKNIQLLMSLLEGSTKSQKEERAEKMYDSLKIVMYIEKYLIDACQTFIIEH
jgi:predicted secreted acid phosphatase